MSELGHKFPQITHGSESSTGVTSPCQAGQVPSSSHLNLIRPQHSSRFNKSRDFWPGNRAELTQPRCFHSGLGSHLASSNICRSPQHQNFRCFSKHCNGVLITNRTFFNQKKLGTCSANEFYCLQLEVLSSTS